MSESTASTGAPIPEVVVVGEGMSLRAPREDDAEALLALGADPEVTQWFSWGPYTTIAEPLAYIAQARAWREAGTQVDLLVVDDEAGPIGITGLSEISIRDRRAVVGTWLTRTQWGTGANARSKALVLHYAFAALHLERVGAYADVRNARSQRALEKLGFRREGVLRAFHRHGDEAKDVVLYSILAHEWTPSPGVTVHPA